MVRFVTELAFYLNRLPVAYDVVQIFSAQCRNRTGDALLGAVALECGIHRIVDLGEHNADRAMNYYMGMSTDAIDIICSQRLPARTRRLVDLLHERIRAGAFLPFVGPIVDQAGQVHVAADVALTPQEIILMDYLAGNVIGRIPSVDELNDVAKGLVSLQGIRAATKE